MKHIHILEHQLSTSPGTLILLFIGLFPFLVNSLQHNSTFGDCWISLIFPYIN